MEAGLINYQNDKCISGESMFEMETSLMNYQHDRCMSGGNKMFKIGQV